MWGCMSNGSTAMIASISLVCGRGALASSATGSLVQGICSECSGCCVLLLCFLPLLGCRIEHWEWSLVPRLDKQDPTVVLAENLECGLLLERQPGKGLDHLGLMGAFCMAPLVPSSAPGWFAGVNLWARASLALFPSRRFCW